MTDQPDCDFDVFISYAVNENEVPSGATEGWVSTFVRTLKQEFGKTHLGKRVGVKIWWDEKSLDRTGDISKELLAILPKVQRARGAVVAGVPGIDLVQAGTGSLPGRHA